MGARLSGLYGTTTPNPLENVLRYHRFGTYQISEIVDHPKNKSFAFDPIYEIWTEEFISESDLGINPSAKPEESMEYGTVTTEEEIIEENMVKYPETYIWRRISIKIGGTSTT